MAGCTTRLNLFQGLLAPGEFLYDQCCCCRPDERLRVFVPGCQVFFNGGNEVGDTSESSPAYPLTGQLSEPALHEIEPARTCRNEVKYETGMSCQPISDLGVLVGAVVVEDHMELQFNREFIIQPL